MKFVEPSAFTDPDVAARKLVEFANAAEAVQVPRCSRERIGIFGLSGSSLKQKLMG